MGYDAQYSLAQKNIIRPTPDLDKQVKIISPNKVETFSQVLFDFGALGKGYFVDRIKEILKDNNLKKFLVDGSGDIYYSGNGDKIKVGLEHPGDSTKVIGILEVAKGSLCGSATNRRAWGNLHHVIDPETSSSTNGIIATWVLSDSAALSDALATCLFLQEPEVFEKDFKFEYLILNSEYRVKRSEGFNAELY